MIHYYPISGSIDLTNSKIYMMLTLVTKIGDFDYLKRNNLKKNMYKELIIRIYSYIVLKYKSLDRLYFLN